MRSVAEIFKSYAEFDADGRHVNGTDKMSNHNYGDVYERIIHDRFSPNPAAMSYDHSCEMARNSVKLMMEVGVADGSSLLAWREVFPNALCVGMDIHPASKLWNYKAAEDFKRLSGYDIIKTEMNRLEFHIGNQCSREDCHRAASGRKFDLIVEDATHLIENTLQTLLYLWPSVRPGGLYIVEEWSNVDREAICELWPMAEIMDTVGPSGGVEPLVVFRKPR